MNIEHVGNRLGRTIVQMNPIVNQLFIIILPKPGETARTTFAVHRCSLCVNILHPKHLLSVERQFMLFSLNSEQI